MLSLADRLQATAREAAAASAGTRRKRPVRRLPRCPLVILLPGGLAGVRQLGGRVAALLTDLGDRAADSLVPVLVLAENLIRADQAACRYS